MEAIKGGTGIIESSEIRLNRSTNKTNVLSINCVPLQPCRMVVQECCHCALMGA